MERTYNINIPHNGQYVNIMSVAVDKAKKIVYNNTKGFATFHRNV